MQDEDVDDTSDVFVNNIDGCVYQKKRRPYEKPNEPREVDGLETLSSKSNPRLGLLQPYKISDGMDHKPDAGKQEPRGKELPPEDVADNIRTLVYQSTSEQLSAGSDSKKAGVSDSASNSKVHHPLYISPASTSTNGPFKPLLSQQHHHTTEGTVLAPHKTLFREISVHESTVKLAKEHGEINRHTVYDVHLDVHDREHEPSLRNTGTMRLPAVMGSGDDRSHNNLRYAHPTTSNDSKLFSDVKQYYPGIDDVGHGQRQAQMNTGSAKSILLARCMPPCNDDGGYNAQSVHEPRTDIIGAHDVRQHGGRVELDDNYSLPATINVAVNASHVARPLFRHFNDVAHCGSSSSIRPIIEVTSTSKWLEGVGNRHGYEESHSMTSTSIPTPIFLTQSAPVEQKLSTFHDPVATWTDMSTASSKYCSGPLNSAEKQISCRRSSQHNSI